MKPRLKQKHLLEDLPQRRLIISSFLNGEPTGFIHIKDGGDLKKKSQGNVHKTPAALRLL